MVTRPGTSEDWRAEVLRLGSLLSPDFDTIHNDAAIKVGKVVKDESQLASGNVDCQRFHLNGVDIFKFHLLQCLILLIFYIKRLNGA